MAAIFVNVSRRNEHCYRGLPIDVSYQVSVHLAKRFQRRRFLEIDQLEKKLPVVAIFVNRTGRNEQSI